MAGARRVYRWLLKLYPARFREEYEAPLERQFLDDYRDAQGVGGRIFFWLHALADLAISIPLELARELRRDVAFAVRIYRRHAVITTLAMATLALAIGVTTGVFSVVNGLLLRGLPFRDPERLVELQRFYRMPNADFHQWRTTSRYLTDVALYSDNQVNLSTTGEALRVKVAETTVNFFSVLGSEPQFGRAFAAGEDVEGHDGVAVISYALWQQVFGGDPRALGSAIRLNGVPALIVGVAPQAFDFPAHTMVWTPTASDFDRIPKIGAFFFANVARLQPGISMARANAMFLADMSGRSSDPEDRSRYSLRSLRDQLAGPVRQASLVLLGTVLFVLLIACANVAHLLLSRTTERRQELVVRTALGASRGRLVQQLITESTLLTSLAAAAGLVVAYGASRFAAAVQPTQLAAQTYTILDWRVLAFAIGIAALTGVLFGVLPASLIGPMHAQLGTRVTAVHRMRSTLLAMQAAFALLLVAGSMSMTRSFLKLMHTDLGMQTDHVITLSSSLMGSQTSMNQRRRQYFDEALSRLRSIPGAESAGAVEYLPLRENIYGSWRFRVDGGAQNSAVPIAATPDYFRTAGIRLVAGRDFTDADRYTSRPVAIVNAEFARGLGDPAALIGRQLTPSYKHPPYTVVGVAETARNAGPESFHVERPFVSQAQVYMPAQQRIPEFLTFVAKVHGDTAPYLAVARDRLRGIDPGVAIYDVKTLDQWFRDALARPRFYTDAMLFFGAFAMLLAVLGIHGVASYSIAQRTHEIGVRLAVGASPDRLRAMLLRQSLLPVAAGVAAGIAGAIALSRFLQHLMESAQPVGAGTCATAALLLGLTAALAVWVATRRIVKFDPMRVLRAE